MNIPPIFFAEIIADLKKEKGFSTGSAESDVKSLSSKIDSSSIYLNAEASKLVAMEVAGAVIEMSERPILDMAEPVKLPNGKHGLYLDQTPLQEVMRRWCDGSFLEMETRFAEIWRNRLEGLNLEEIIRTKGWRELKLKSIEDVFDYVKNILFAPNQNYSNLIRWWQVLGVPEPNRNNAIERWKLLGSPAAQTFAPYSAYAASIEAFFYIGVAKSIVTTRSSNKVDMEYLKYLPFTSVFSSADKLHAQVFPIFSNERQIFIPGVELKTSLGQIAHFWKNLPEKERAKGTFNYAEYPPVDLENAVTRVFDRYLPEWRQSAVEPKSPRDPARDKAIIDHLRPMIEAMEAHKAKKKS